MTIDPQHLLKTLLAAKDMLLKLERDRRILVDTLRAISNNPNTTYSRAVALNGLIAIGEEE